MQPSPFGLRGFLIDAPAYGSLRSHRDGALIVADGKIAEIGDYDDLRKRQRAEPIHWIDRGAVAIFPGAIEHRALSDLESFSRERSVQARSTPESRTRDRSRFRCGSRPPS